MYHRLEETNDIWQCYAHINFWDLGGALTFRDSCTNYLRVLYLLMVIEVECLLSTTELNGFN